jgi:hypothetical protein
MELSPRPVQQFQVLLKCQRLLRRDGPGAISRFVNPEIAAQEALTALQGSIQKGHFLTRHSPMIELPDLYRRATTGITPEGIQSYKTNATRFLIYTDMQAAIDRAIRAYRSGSHTDSAVVDMHRVVGEGYYKGSGVYGRARTVVVHFNEYGQPVSAFPSLPKKP